MNKTILATAAAIILGGTVLASSVEAYRGDPNVKGPNYSAERHEAMTQAFTNNDYQAWKNLMAGKGRVTQIVNENNFSRFAEAHRLSLAGQTDAAKQIRTELGLGLGGGYNKGYGNNSRFNR